jgi:hypothetical protein
MAGGGGTAPPMLPVTEGELARLIAIEIECLIAQKGVAVLVLDGAPALAGVYRQLSAAALPWTRVIVFQLAEWRGRTEDDPQAGRYLLHEALICRVPIAEFHGLRGEAANPVAVAANYEARWRSRRPALAVISLDAAGVPGWPPVLRPDPRLNESPGMVEVGSSALGLTCAALRECEQLFLVGQDHRGLFESSRTRSFVLPADSAG